MVIVSESGDRQATGESAWSSVFTLANTAIGVGVLGFPYAYRLTGVLGGTILCLFVATLELYTLRTLVRAADKYSVFSYQAVVQKAFGRVAGHAASLLLSCSLVVYLYGSLVAYLILLGDVGSSLARSAVADAGSVLAQRWLWTSAPAIVVCLPLCLTRSLGALSMVSSMAVVALIYTTLAIMGLSTERIVEHPEVTDAAVMFSFTLDSFKALPMLVFAFQCHATVVQIYAELEESPSLLRCSAARPGESEPRHPEDGGEAAHHHHGPGAPLLFPGRQLPGAKLNGMFLVVSVAIAECLIGYSLVGTFGYLAYPAEVESDVLNSFPEKNLIIQIARVMMGITGIVSYPVNLFPCRQAFNHLMAAMCRVPPAVEASKFQHISVTLGLFFASLMAALMVSDLGKVFEVVGGTAGAIMIFVLPGLVAIMMEHEEATCDLLGDLQDEEDDEGALSKPFRFLPSMIPGVIVLVFGATILLHTLLSETLLKT